MENLIHVLIRQAYIVKSLVVVSNLLLHINIRKELRLILLVVIGIGLLVYRIGVGRLLRGAWRRVLHRRRTGDGG